MTLGIMHLALATRDMGRCDGGHGDGARVEGRDPMRGEGEGERCRERDRRTRERERCREREIGTEERERWLGFWWRWGDLGFEGERETGCEGGKGCREGRGRERKETTVLGGEGARYERKREREKKKLGFWGKPVGKEEKEKKEKKKIRVWFDRVFGLS